MNLVNVEGYSNLMKDASSGGVVNVDRNAYTSYMAKKEVALKNIQQQKTTQETVGHLQQQINTIQGDLQNIRDLLIQLTQKGN